MYCRFRTTGGLQEKQHTRGDTAEVEHLIGYVVLYARQQDASAEMISFHEKYCYCDIRLTWSLQRCLAKEGKGSCG